MENRKHYAAGIAAFLIWGFFAIPLRALSDYEAGQILYFRILFSFVAISLLVFFLKQSQLKTDLSLLRSFSKSKRNTLIVLTLVGGALLTINWLTFIYIVNEINIKTASFSYLICPVITAALGSLLLHEKLTSRQWLSVALCAFSCALIGISSLRELGFSFLTALTYALYLVSQRRNQGFDRIIVLGIQILFALIILTLLVNTLVGQVPVEGKFYGIVLVISVVFTVLPLFLNLYALNKVNSATIGIIMYINPLLNFSIALLFYGERVDALQLTGYAIILAAIILFNVDTIRRKLA